MNGEMTWWRRNWLDVLMVALVIAVIVGFLALIFRNNLPRLFGGGATVVVTEEATPPAATSPGANDAATATVGEETAPQASEEASASDATAGAASAASATTENAATTPADEAHSEAAAAAATQAEEAAPLVEAAPAETASSEAPTTKDAATAAEPVGSEASAPENTPDASLAPAETAATAAVPEAGPSTGPASRAEYRASYRVAIATFKDAARAERLAEKVRASGESKTWAVDTGDSAVVLVGPFTDEADARAALERVKANYPDAVLYRPSKASANPAQASVQASPVSTATQEPQVTSAEGSVTLQLGAFKDPGSADKLIASLDGTGYHVTVRSSPDGLTRVLLGPLTPSERAKAEAALRERGINPFPSR